MASNLELRKYNWNVLHRTRMHMYTKKHVDYVAHKAICLNPVVMVEKLTDEDIAQYKKDFKDDKFQANVSKKKCSEEEVKPQRKKIKLDVVDKKEPETKESEVKEPEVLKLVLSREGETDKFKSQFKSTLKNQKDNASNNSNSKPSTSSVSPPVSVETTGPIEPDVSTKPSIPQNNYGKIRVRDIKTMMDESQLKRYNFLFFDKKSKPAVSVKKIITPNNTTNNAYPVSKGNLSLLEIENLYIKYFTKSVQDNIAIIANILNIISLSNKHHKARMDESFKKRSEAEKLKERCDANRIHTRHKKILEAKLKDKFNEVVLSFAIPDFEHTFQMFFLSILTVLRVLDQPKFRKGSIFKNLVLLLWNSLKNSNFDHPKIYNMFRSKSFRPDCIDLISLIEDSRDSDPGITDRMALFFVSTVNSREYFQTVIDAVTSDSIEDLGLLIDNAINQCCINSRFKDPKESSAVKLSITPEPKPQQANQQWTITKTLEENIQPLKLADQNQPQKNLESPLTNKPLHTFYETFSNSLLTRVPSESVANPKPVAPKVSIFAPTVNSKSTQRTPTTIVTFKPSIQNIGPITTTATIQRTEGSSTIYLGNQKYQLIKASNPNNIVLTAKPKHILDPSLKCAINSCKNAATIMCSTCTSVKYCSHKCQRLDWYENHINNCGKLLAAKNNATK